MKHNPLVVCLLIICITILTFTLLTRQTLYEVDYLHGDEEQRCVTEGGCTA
ncbi:Hok/Gef family protein [Escherichia coli]|nr:Hok/Gef family protein [Escherichia coli]